MGTGSFTFSCECVSSACKCGTCNKGCSVNHSNFGRIIYARCIKKIAEKPQGLVLVTGPTGSGKSTTLASMIQFMNETMRRHIITLEDPIEYLHKHGNCIVEQREVGFDTNNFAMG